MLDVKMIQESFEKVKPIAPRAVAFFYEYMFEKYPAAKAMFKPEKMEAQQAALIASLVHIVTNLENTAALTVYLKKMGARHDGYGVRDEHYAIVGECLLHTFRHFFKEAWTNELHNTWAAAYGLIGETMMAGAREQRESLSIANISDYAARVARQTLMESINRAANSEFQKAVEEVARRTLKAAVEQEAKNLLAAGKKAA